MSHRTSLHQAKDEEQIYFLVSWSITICSLVGGTNISRRVFSHRYPAFAGMCSSETLVCVLECVLL